MIPLPIAGIAITGSALLSKYAAARKAGRPAEFLKVNPGPLQMPATIRLPDLSGQLQNAVTDLRTNVIKGLKSGAIGNMKPDVIENFKTNVLGGLSSSIAKFTKSLAGEDYTKIVKEFSLAEAVIIKPRHLSNTGELGLADIDGDLSDELIASYRSSEGVGTVVLKKYNDQWFKEAELVIPGYDSITFRDISDVTGTGKQHLLIGLPSDDKKTLLHTYALEGGSFHKLFERSCSKFELLGMKNTAGGGPKKVQFAFWDKENDGAYRIELSQWNGLELETVADKSGYYNRKVLPLQAQMLRRNPYSTVMWYNFANMLADAGYTEDAISAMDTGLQLDKTAAYTARFAELRKRLE